jgi:hypothetical protein
MLIDEFAQVRLCRTRDLPLVVSHTLAWLASYSRVCGMHSGFGRVPNDRPRGVVHHDERGAAGSHEPGHSASQWDGTGKHEDKHKHALSMSIIPPF